MKKAVVESASAGIEYADIPLAPGTSARSNLLFDLKRDHMYLMTDKKLSKVRVQDCEQCKDCNQCLRVKHPYCGWCSLENKAGTGIGQDNILMQCSHNGQINYTTVRRNLKEDGTPEKLL